MRDEPKERLRRRLRSFYAITYLPGAYLELKPGELAVELVRL